MWSQQQADTTHCFIIGTNLNFPQYPHALTLLKYATAEEQSRGGERSPDNKYNVDVHEKLLSTYVLVAGRVQEVDDTECIE